MFSCSVVSDSLQPHGLQHARLPRPSPSTRACSSSYPLSRWCHPNHLILCCSLLLLPSDFPRIRVFSNQSALRIRWPSIGASASVLPVNIQHWFPLGLTDRLINCWPANYMYILCVKSMFLHLTHFAESSLILQIYLFLGLPLPSFYIIHLQACYCPWLYKVQIMWNWDVTHSARPHLEFTQSFSVKSRQERFDPEDNFQSLKEVPIIDMLPSSKNKKSWLWENPRQTCSMCFWSLVFSIQRLPETSQKQHD